MKVGDQVTYSLDGVENKTGVITAIEQEDAENGVPFFLTVQAPGEDFEDLVFSEELLA